ncbi:putative ribonuclease H-like domain-containing protein [Tanacetum coccineum]|uniref:Ribonuclease H-like domain-containing protein n=2 Tax=Tanacetum coccineum TaxID=301880 RepID=A0ABQ5H0T2_9ASTR
MVHEDLQYIAITDPLLWDIITNETKPQLILASPSVSAPQTSLAASARKTMRKPYYTAFPAIPDRHLHRFRNERFQHILTCLNYMMLPVSIEDANLKFLRRLPSVWPVVSLKFKTAQNIAFSSLRSQGPSTLKQNEIICSISLAQHILCPQHQDDEEPAANGRSIDSKPKNGITLLIESRRLNALMAKVRSGCRAQCTLRQDGLDDFDWSNKADDATRDLLALMLQTQSTLLAIPEKILQGLCIIDSDALEYDRRQGQKLKFNLLSVPQIYDKKHNVLFTDKECLILSPKFKFVDEDLIILRAPRKNDVYSLDPKHINSLWVENHLFGLQKQQRIEASYGTEDWGIVQEFQLMNEFLLPRKEQEKYSIASTPHKMRNRTAKLQKKLICPLIDQALHDELRKRGKISIAKRKNILTATFTLSTANTPPQSIGNTPKDPDDILQQMVFSPPNSFDAEEGGTLGSTRRKLQDSTSNQHQALLSFIYKQNRTNHKDIKHACLLVSISRGPQESLPQALADESSLKAIAKKKLPFNSSYKVWGVSDLPEGKRHGYRRGAIDKTLFIKKDRRDIMLVQVYVDDIIFGSTKSSMVKDFEDLMQKEFKMSSMGELTFFLGLQVKQSNGGIFLSQDKYVKDILNKFDFRTIKPASTPIEAHKSLGKDEEGEDVDVHLYRSMIGCLMYLTASRPDIMFAVCLCARFQVTPKVSHLHAVKRIFRYLKHQPNLGLWYPKDSPFHLEAFSDSDYAGDNHDRRSTSGGCQYLGRRLVSWQCKKQTIVAISSTEAEYVAAASCCAQVLWMQNQLLDYGFNFMNTEIHIDNESTICIVKNPVFHSKTKHIQIRHHFIRDCYEQRLINVVKVHTDDNVADLLTKGFDLARFNFLVVTIGMMNP